MATAFIPLGLALILSIPAARVDSNLQPLNRESSPASLIGTRTGIRPIERLWNMLPRRISSDQRRREFDPPATAAIPAASAIPEAPPRVKPSTPPPTAPRMTKPTSLNTAGPQTVVLRLQHMPVTDTSEVIQRWLKSQQPSADQAAASVVSEVISNSLVMTGSPEQLSQIKEIVAALDRPLPHVRVKTLLVVLELNEAPQPAVGTSTTVLNDDLDKILTDLQQRGTVRVLARPELMAAHNQPARLQIGGRVPRITGTTSTGNMRQNQVTFENVGTLLGITARVADEDTVTMEIDLEQSHFGAEATGTPISSVEGGETVRIPPLQTVNLQTTVSLRSSQTVVLGGMAYQTEQGWEELLLIVRPQIVP